MLYRALAAAAVILVSAIPALAEPPPVGSVPAFAKPQVICKLGEQIVAIYEAGRDSGAAAAGAAYTPFYQAKQCGVAQVRGLAVASIEYLGTATLNDIRIKAWLIHLKSPRGEIWMLYDEVHPPLPGEEA